MQFLKTLNIPNKLTLLRIILVIPIIILATINTIIFHQSELILNEKLNSPTAVTFFISNILFFLIFIIAMITDYFDGKIARSKNLITPFGKLWDPLADKMITTTALIYLTAISYTPIWSTLLFILRDLIVDGCRGLLIKNNKEVAANYWGKLKTMLMSIAIPIILLFLIIAQPLASIKFDYWIIMILNIPLFIAQFFSLFSGLIYIKSTWKFML
ncbi:CDP-diacylglycerol--glycerol-3-phosphate 3-phosphatidyltransferase [Mycoplasmopsis mustelae]|uniref:CDP-diacylglycerol--glycerol-3-phosphate 3-phosphatidyltransferase n=1 Tax=Mycoplasmopsis mustelae TaxID=171289 RepID=A0A4V3FNV1_9BACT|nr:CDP-diacylglycerol--glycerol-3-phosphate 3-phosphatidyltransferase [Mycoplasmopsis mustelae]TDV23279.1 CDP-diacylglycerol--glycerol-3-phosphate 3-phosphatidyltransferase [Mycoplasmopsis mustelae]